MLSIKKRYTINRKDALTGRAIMNITNDMTKVIAGTIKPKMAFLFLAKYTCNKMRPTNATRVRKEINRIDKSEFIDHMAFLLVEISYIR